MKNKKLARAKETKGVAEQNGGRPNGDGGAPFHGPTHEDIALLAYRIWETQGCPENRALDHWLIAEQELRGTSQAQDS